MSTVQSTSETSVTPEKVQELVDRIVRAVAPVEVIAFGSRARRQHHRTSDLDLAVIVDGTEENYSRLPYGIQSGIDLNLDLLTVPKERFDRLRPWINTVQRQIDREGVRLYVRGGQPPDRATLLGLC